MIKNITFCTYSTFIQLTWTTPRFLPLHYRLSALCRYPSGLQTFEMLTDPSIESSNLSGSVLSMLKLQVPTLPPYTLCMMTFMATYNPATLDEGISRAVIAPGKYSGKMYIHA